LALGFALASPLALAGCVTDGLGGGQSGSSAPADNFAETVASATATLPKPVRQGGYGPIGVEAQNGGGQGQYFPGSAVQLNAPERPNGGAPPVAYVADVGGGVVPSGLGGTQLNFEGADVGVVCKAIFGDVLKANYFVDQRVSGQISLTSSQPVPTKNLVPLLERALATIGATVVRDADLYRIVPAADTGGVSSVAVHAAGEGFGTTIIAAKYVAAPTIARMLESLGSKGGSVRVDNAMNLVLVQGSASERRAAMDAADMLDVDWLRSKSVAILPVGSSSPEAVVAELNKILDTGEGGLSQNIVQLEPMARLNAVLAVSRRPDAVNLVAKWVARLERADHAANNIKVYRLQYAQAKTVAQMLRDMFRQSGANDPAPAAIVRRLRRDRRLQRNRRIERLQRDKRFGGRIRRRRVRLQLALWRAQGRLRRCREDQPRQRISSVRFHGIGRCQGTAHHGRS
jgi:general secretion pathway protein D